MSLRLALVLAAALASSTALARGPAPSSESFTPRAATDALDQPGGKASFTLEAGHAYTIVKRGGPQGAWCKLDGGGKSGWVLCDKTEGAKTGVSVNKDDGEDADPRALEALKDPRDRKRGKAPGGASCETTCSGAPLFPNMPALTPLDREILAICPARPDVSVSASEVRRFFAAHYDDRRLQLALSAAGRPGSGAGVKESNLTWLTGLWVSSGPKNAFTHVFCGDDWTTEKLGGLHFLPRYAQLESEGKLCYGGAAKGRDPVKGEQYLIRYSGLSPWSCGQKKLGGFPVNHDPIDLVATATRAFARCCERNGERKEGGVYQAPDLGGPAWRIWCNSRNGTYGIASMYPTDEKPTCRE